MRAAAAPAPPGSPPSPPAVPQGAPALFGPLVSLGQGYLFGEALTRNAANADGFVDRLCAESARLREHPPMKTLEGRAHDAAQFMADLIDYEKPLDQPPGRLHLPEELALRLGPAGPQGNQSDWGARITSADLAALDFSWLRTLGAFDHWTVLSAGRLRDFPANDFFSTPIPNYISLTQWARLRFVLARRRGDHVAASGEVRHLAALLRTQNILISDMIAVAIYRIDDAARRFAAAAGADVSGWLPADLDGLDRFRQTAFASMYFAYPGVKPETLRKAVACTGTPCTTLIEGAGANRAFGAYASDNLQLVLELAAKQGCEPAMLARAVATEEVPAAKALEILGDDLEAQIPKRFPR